MTFLTIYCLGFIGLIAFGLIPFRTWSLLRYTFHKTKENKTKFTFIAFLAVILAPIEIFQFPSKKDDK